MTPEQERDACTPAVAVLEWVERWAGALESWQMLTVLDSYADDKAGARPE